MSIGVGVGVSPSLFGRFSGTIPVTSLALKFNVASNSQYATTIVGF